MEATTQLLIVLSCAIGAMSFLVIMRRTMRSPSTPSFIAHDITANVMALMLTGAFAASLYFVGAALQAFVPTWVAFFATFVFHGCLFAACSYVLPADEASQAVRTAPPSNQIAGASA